MEPNEPSQFDHEKEKIERLRRAMYSRALSDKFKNRERRELESPHSTVGEDWVHQEQGNLAVTVAPLGITLARTLLYWMLVGSIVFFVGAVTFFGYYFTFGAGSLSASSNNIDIVISGPSQVAGGEPTEIQVSLTNHNTVALELAQLVITYPDGTRSVNDFLTSLLSVRQDLQIIRPGETKRGVLNAIFSGQAGEHKEVKVELEYRLNGSNAIFVASRQYGLLFGSSPLSISIDGNVSSISGQPLAMKVTIASNANVVVRDVILHVDYPFGFKFSSANPVSAGVGLWNIGDIAPGQKKSIVINGVVLGEMGDDKVFNFTAGSRANASSSIISTQFAENKFHVGVAQPFLGLSLSVNGSATSSIVLSAGDIAAVTLNYVNNLPSQITDAVIVARLSGVEIDGSTFQSAEGFYRSADNVMFWDKTTTNGRFAIIKSGQKGSVNFSFKIPALDASTRILNPYIDISVNAKGNRVADSDAPQNLQSATIQHIALASDLQLSAQGLYYQNPFGALGAMPPQANKETNYAIVFTIKNTTNKIRNTKITAILPPYMRWVGSYVPANEKLTFNQNSSTFTWDVGEIAPGVGLNGSDPRQVAIAVALSPSTNQIGQQLVLIQDVVLTGVDDSTGLEIIRTAKPNVTTNLIQVAKSAQEISIGTDKGFDPTNAVIVK